MTADISEERGELPGPEATSALIAGRRTVNRFRPECPPRARVHEALELARWAPNHHLTEPWRFYLLGESSKAAIVDLNRALVAERKGEAAAQAKAASWQAIPGWLVVTRVRASTELQAWEDYAACSCAIHNLALYLWSRGIGCKWTTGAVTREPRFYEQLGIAADEEIVVGLIWYGYPYDNPTTRRHPIEERLFELP